MAWIYLILAGITEVFFAICLKYSEQFTKLVPTLFFIFFSALSFLLMSRSMSSIHIGVVYAVWSGIGTLGTVIASIFLFDEPINMAKAFFMGLLLLSIIGLKISG